MSETGQELATEYVGPTRGFLGGVTIKEVITSSEPSVVRDHLSSLLLVKNLVLLLGSGASFHEKHGQGVKYDVVTDYTEPMQLVVSR